MKKFVRFIGQCLLSGMLASGMGIGAMALGASDSVVIATAVFGGLMFALVIGVFDEDENEKKMVTHESIKHRNGLRYNDAA